MMVNGKWMDNITCPRCRFRHPSELTCEEARLAAQEGKGSPEEPLPPIPEEVSHVAQWQELTTRARNFDLSITLDGSSGFDLWAPRGELIGSYGSFADLRAGISDWVAAQRAAGARI